MNKTKSVVFVALSAAFLGLFSQILLPFPSGIPVTLQTFAVLFVSALPGWKKGVAAVGIWLLMGAVGLPVFAGFQGGLAALAGPTGGFLTGFCFLALFGGWAKSVPLLQGILRVLPGLLLCHLMGTAWFAFSTEISVPTALLTASLPYWIKDLLLVPAALWCAACVQRHLPLFRE